MLFWIMTAVLAAVVGYIVRLEIKCGRRNDERLERTSAEIATITQRATLTYRAKFGEDPPISLRAAGKKA